MKVSSVQESRKEEYSQKDRILRKHSKKVDTIPHLRLMWGTERKEAVHFVLS